MKRLAVAVACLLVSAGCDSTAAGQSITLPPEDAGPDAVAVVLDGGGTPATPPDGASLCPAGACNYQTGSGCAAGASCLPSVSGGAASPACTAAGTVAAGGACSLADDCVAGHLCAGGSCRKLCCGGDWTGCDGASEHCLENVAYSTSTGALETGAMICLPVDTCDALAPSSCTTAGTTCQIADATGATACLAEGTGEAGQPCPCKGGFACVSSTSGAEVCVRLCKAVVGGGAPYCQAGEGICTHYVRDPPGVGECLPPAQ